jgi:tetratricopeptide (TPR) repeat protein
VEPIGTITNFFPFLEEETQQALKSMMDKALDYNDFVVHLGNKVAKEDVSLELARMAAIHIYLARDRYLQDKLRNKYIKIPEILVWTYPLLGVSDDALFGNELRALLKKAIERDLPNWLLIHLYFLIERDLSKTPYAMSEVLKKVESIFNRDQNLACFEFILYHLKSGFYGLEGEAVRAILALQKGLEMARDVNDVFRIMAFVGTLCFLLKDHDIEKAWDHAEEFNNLSQTLGLLRYQTVARHYMGHVYLIRGEYDMAIECNYAAWELFYSDTGPSQSSCAVMSNLHSLNGDGKEALHWANESFRISEGKGDIVMHQAKAYALVLLDRLDDAEVHLNTMHQLSIESASEMDQARYLLMRGIHNIKDGAPQDAIMNIEQALSIHESLNSQAAINMDLLALTEIEIQLVEESSSEDSSGPWMVRLESHARKKGYPGIQMQAALLRAEFFVKHGRKDEARTVLQEALEILDSPTVKTLRGRINTMLEDLLAA